jgi:hypothetical protein
LAVDFDIMNQVNLDDISEYASSNVSASCYLVILAKIFNCVV